MAVIPVEENSMSQKNTQLTKLIFFVLLSLVLYPAHVVRAQDDNKEPLPLQEKTIYIPFEKLRDVFEKDNRKVVLSYEEFNKLWEAARKSENPKTAEEAKRGSIISQADSRAEVRTHVVSVQSDLKIELMSSGWS